MLGQRDGQTGPCPAGAHRLRGSKERSAGSQQYGHRGTGGGLDRNTALGTGRQRLTLAPPPTRPGEVEGDTLGVSEEEGFDLGPEGWTGQDP